MNLENLLSKVRRINQSLTPSKRWKPMLPTNDPHPEGQVFANDRYVATLRKYESGWVLDAALPWAQIGIYCEDGQPRHDWREFQRIKNDLVGVEWEALELYPAESRLLDPSNYFILYCAPKLPFGKFVGRQVIGPLGSTAPQRGWL